MDQMGIERALSRAMSLHQAGNLAEAEAIYRQVLAVEPNQPDAAHMMGLIAASVGRLDLAAQLIRKAIEVKPDTVSFHFNLGIVLRDAGDLNSAIKSYRAATRLDPGYVRAWYNLGNALQATGQSKAAIDAYRCAIAIDPNDCDALNNLGAVLQASGEIAQAVEVLEKAVELQPELPDAHNNLGKALTESGDAKRAVASCRRAVDLAPDSAEAHNNLASAFLVDGEIDAAMNEYHRAVVLKPDYALAHCNLGMQMLLRGDFSNGWREFEWRRGAKELDAVYDEFPQPLWDGSPLHGKRILVQAEQGFGDVIQFSRYLMLPEFRAAKSVAFQCYAELIPILGSIDGVRIVPAGATLPEFDAHIPLMSLPKCFNTSVETIPRSTAVHVRADQQQAARWGERLACESRRKVGLAWAGRARHRNDRQRSMQLSVLQRLGEASDVAWISLQKGEPAEQAKNPPVGLKLVDWMDEIEDFSGTAALIENLDLVITVDTAVAHLAGAMGKPVWVMLPFVPDWRWMLRREDSPWYPTMRLIRQQKLGDWEGVVQRVTEMLQGFGKAQS